MNRKRRLCIAVLAVFAVAFICAFAATRASAQTGPCLQRVFQEIGCAGCQSNSCQNCTDGTCQGTTKKCANRNNCERGYPTGWKMLIVKINPACYTVYQCVPENGGTCNNDDNPCVADWDSGQDSTTTFNSTEVCVVACPGEPM